MKRIPFFLSLFAGFLIILVSVYGFFLLRQRPGIPLDMYKSLEKKVEEGELVRIQGVEIQNLKMDLEFLASQKTIGDTVEIVLADEGIPEKQEVKLVPFYDSSLPLYYLLVGLFCFISGTVVFLLRSDDRRARTYYWAFFALGSATAICGGFYCLQKHWLSFLPGVFYYLLYPLSAGMLLHFSLYFSKLEIKLWKFIIYIPSLIFVCVLEWLFLSTGLNSSIEIHRIYQVVFDFHRFYLVVYVLLSFAFLILGYRKADFEEEKSQIKWIFYGLIVGLGPFILFYQLPQALGLNALLSEEFSTMFFIFIPLAFAFSIVKFKLMDVELVINRSLVYFTLTVFTVGFYLFSVNLIQNVVSRFFAAPMTAISVSAALLAAVAFHPARKTIQNFVDRAFFRMSYDYRKVILRFNEKAYEEVNRGRLIDLFLQTIKEALPLESIAIFIFALGSGKQKLLIAKNEEKDLVSLAPLSLEMDKVFARKNAVRTEENMDFSKEKLLEEKGIDMCLPLSFKSSDLTGFLSLGKKKSGEKFSRDDIDLLLAMSRDLALNLERIRLLEEVIYERVEKEKLSDLIQLKTEFISSVSHELRTPMSSIRGLAEILQEGKIKEKAKQEELIRLVATESSRLSRFLHNILDFGKIEKNVKTYNFQKEELQSVIKETVQLFQYRSDSDEFVLQTKMPEKPLFLEMDRDAVIQALTNLLDNAIKYSSSEKRIVVELAQKAKSIVIKVKDKGIGIPTGEQKKIFEGFYRHAEANRHSTTGVGLGLKIVKHIMSGHGGEIQVESHPGEGSTFSLIFPAK
ncbi:MAG: GHKL domain-containing protein [Candidatus Aminicenantes bacterium]|nr:MAG: GHKL domain-containing protein [Candidatus Aminicenantes bacterium]